MSYNLRRDLVSPPAGQHLDIAHHPRQEHVLEDVALIMKTTVRGTMSAQGGIPGSMFQLT